MAGAIDHLKDIHRAHAHTYLIGIAYVIVDCNHCSMDSKLRRCTSLTPDTVTIVLQIGMDRTIPQHMAHNRTEQLEHACMKKLRQKPNCAKALPARLGHVDNWSRPNRDEESMRISRARATASIIGVFAGVTGTSHGPGEMLQGNKAPSGVMIEAWPELTSLGGEPAMTIVPSFLITGILAIILGLVVTVWAAVFVQKKNGGVVLILLSIIMLLVGGGIVPPIFGIAAGVIGTRIKPSA